MNYITFSENWDKLRAPRFTTIRSYRREKEAHYRRLIGSRFQIRVASGDTTYRMLGTATLLSVRVVRSGDLPAEEIRTDVMLRGEPSRIWEARLTMMGKALRLEFSNHVDTGVPAREASP